VKKLLAALLVLAVVSAAYLTFQRYQVVNNNRTVELVMDYNSLAANDQTTSLLQLKKQGLTSLALHQQSLQQLAEQGEIDYITGQLLELLTEFKIAADPDNLQALYITGAPEVLRQIQQAAGGELLQPRLLQLTDYSQQLLTEPLVFPAGGREQGVRLGLNLLPRISGKYSLEEFQQVTAAYPELQQVIFSGSQVVGYPEQVGKTAQVFREERLVFGLIEPFLARQRGAVQLAQLADLRAVRVHSIQPEELASLGVEKAVARCLRAVTERGVRLLYLPAFAQSKKTEQLVADLSRTLANRGYHLGTAEPYVNYQPPLYLLGLILVGTAALLGLTLEQLVGGFGFTGLVLGSLSLGGLAVIDWHPSLQLAALLTAVLVPGWGFLYLVKCKEENLSSLQVYFWLLGFSLGGGILIRGLLSATDYLLQVEKFRGVKLAFTVPLLVSGGYLLGQHYQEERGSLQWDRFLNRPVQVKEVIAGSLLAAGGVIYITRTGNLPLVEVSQLELAVRRGLEEIFPVRPRFKSFLVGHPLLLVGITRTLHRAKVSWLAVIGLIGPINVINTFAHLHTPVLVVLLRVGEGIVLGTGLGLTILKMINEE